MVAARTDVLDDLPFLGRVVPELGDPAIRELALYSYRIIYALRDHGVFILAVIHKQRDLQPEMIER